MDNKLREIEVWAENIKLPYALRQLLHYSGDTIKRLTDENEIVRQALENVKAKLSEAWQERDEARSLLRQKEDENKRLQSTIQKALATWEGMDDFDDAVTVIEQMKSLIRPPANA